MGEREGGVDEEGEGPRGGLCGRSCGSVLLQAKLALRKGLICLRGGPVRAW